MDLRQLSRVIYSTAIFLLISSSLNGEFIPAGSLIKSISQKSSIKVSQYCGDPIQCRSQLNQTQCLQLKVCQEKHICNGRSGLPASENPFQDWTIQRTTKEGCFVSEEKPSGLPSSFLFLDNIRMLTVNSSDSCHVRRNNTIGDAFSLTFWIKADCANCSVLDLSQTGQPTIHVRVADGDLVCMGDECFQNDHLQQQTWAFIALTVYKEAIILYVDGKQLKEMEQSVVDNLFIGSTEVTSSNNLFYILHAQFFHDVLTPREIEEMTSGLVDLTVVEPSCRCTPDHPIVSKTQESMCENKKVESYPRYSTTYEFNSPDVVLDGLALNWASAEQGPVVLMLNLSLSYQLESIEIDFLQPPPDKVTFFLISNGVEKPEQVFTCSNAKCRVALPSLDKTATVTDFGSKIADGVKIVIHRDHNDDVRSFILDDITINGRCDCHGNAASCTVDGDSYSCACDANTNTKGRHCQSCQSNFFRRNEDFDCPNSCQCYKEGVANENDQCDENGGKCYCKEHVTGFACDNCKPWTYDLDSSNVNGCTACPCYQPGSESCSNDGVCTCKKNVALPNCQACKENHFGFAMPQGCEPCGCHLSGTISQDMKCQNNDGQCHCKTNVEGRKCDSCKAGFYNLETANLSGCKQCKCNPVGIENSTCHISTGQCSCRGGVVTDQTCAPEIISIDPTFGPLMGGTKVMITGKLLGNYTRSVSVYLGNIEQPILAINDSVIIVETKQDQALKSADLKVGWVQMSNTLKAPSPFSYKRDPVLDGSKTVQGPSIVSGGCNVNLYGINLHSVKYPVLRLMPKNKPDQVSNGKCHHIAGLVVCQTPDVSNFYSSGHTIFEMIAAFDSITFNLGTIDVKPDPIIRNVGNIEYQYPFEDSITISGKNLLSACETNGYTVLIGLVHCSITHVSNSGIECEPPKLTSGDSDKFIITVKIGNIERRVGTLEYLKFYETTGFIIIISCIAALIVIIIAIIILRRCYLSRRKNANTPRMSKLVDNDTRSTNRQMNTYTELDNVANDVTYSNGLNNRIKVESVFREPKKGIINTEAETSILQDEFIPHVEPGLRTAVEGSFIGAGSFGVGTTLLVAGKNAKLVDGHLHNNGRTLQQRLLVKSFIGTIKENLHPPGDDNSLLVNWAHQALNECLRFRKYKHNHLLHAIGIGVDQYKIHLLYEYMSKGSLKNVIADTDQDYSVRKLLGFSQQVAEGIAFLTSKDVTHKDVAARNCMLDEYSVVKLGDAAFAWDFYPNEYVYNEQRERYLPLRWMAPETIDHGYYDMKTDVWSFGILVWELLTRGCLPFHEVIDTDVSEYILNGYVLGKPETISDDLYNLLRSCWSPEIENRLSIASVSSNLCQILETDDEDTYENVSTLGPTPRAGSYYYSSTNISGV